MQNKNLSADFTFQSIQSGSPPASRTISRTRRPSAAARRAIVNAVLAVAIMTAASQAMAEVMCTATFEAGGALEKSFKRLGKIKQYTGLEGTLVTVGKAPGHPHSTASVWIGVEVTGNTVIFGKGSAKTGVLIKCDWDLADPTPTQQMESLKRSVPTLLQDKKFQKAFPGIEKIDVAELQTLEKADKDCAAEILEFAKTKKP